MKRHRNIHEKYGRTKPNPPAQQTSEENSGENMNNQDNQEQIEIAETKFEEPKYEESDPTSEITEEMAEISELQVQLS